MKIWLIILAIMQALRKCLWELFLFLAPFIGVGSIILIVVCIEASYPDTANILQAIIDKLFIILCGIFVIGVVILGSCKFYYTVKEKYRKLNDKQRRKHEKSNS